MYSKLLLSICVVLLPLWLTGQNKDRKITDSKSGLPVAYVNIGVLNQNIGTVSDEAGRFSLVIPPGHEKDTLVFSMLGYEDKIMLVKTFTEWTSPVFSLTPRPVITETVEINAKDFKTINLGNKGSPNINAGYTSNDLGSELGIPVKLKGSPTFLEKLHIQLAKSIYDTLFFRMNIYRMEKGKPGKSLLKENIFITTTQKSGRFSVDLTPYNIIVYEDFVIALEWVKDFESQKNSVDKKSGLLFQAGMNGPTFIRKTSQGGWEKIPIGIGLNADVSYFTGKSKVTRRRK
ncbi:MAG: carboxypeptidase-like regulatory domain-containing protein [Bacteroidia bacterium]|nr:carboxypeptidase-like regulatory domain-containing protein [Bacteroidia bacterium]